jgi:hypothetical protein
MASSGPMACMCPCECKARDDGVDTVALKDLVNEIQNQRGAEWEAKEARGEPFSSSGWLVLNKQESTALSDTVMCGWKRKLDEDTKRPKIVVDCDQLKIPPLTSAMVLDDMIMCTKTDATCQADDCARTCTMLQGVPGPDKIMFRDSHQRLDVKCLKIDPGQYVPDNPFDPIPYGDLSYTCTIKGTVADLQKLLNDEVHEKCNPSDETQSCTPAALFNPSFLLREQTARSAVERPATAVQSQMAPWVDDPRVHLLDYFIHMQDHTKKANYSMAVEKAGLFVECKDESAPSAETCTMGLGFEAIMVKFLKPQ